MRFDPETHWLTYYNTLLRYHLGIDPDSLDDTEWWLAIKALEYIRQQEAKQTPKPNQ